jgi:hypothetical protein
MLIDKGKEGSIYAYDKYALKIYHPYTKYNKLEQEYDFLHTYKNTSIVPQLYSNKSILKDYIIIMEYLENYITLYQFGKVKKTYSLLMQNNLLIELARARYIIGKNTYYSDLHTKNVMVNIEKMYVKFIYPGSSCMDNMVTRYCFKYALVTITRGQNYKNT